jgi:EAL domain-containing protein (putative c-di-GMP-specific phosphodiesterase class I)
MSEVSARAFSIQTDLVAGIERQELRLHYQAKVDLRTGAMVGAEALVRWQRPLHGLLGPAEFIATAEKTGTVVAIDKWVLNEALRQISEWTTAGLWAPQWRLAVNQNAADLRRKSMLDELKHLLRMHKVDAQALEMEITEGALLEHTQEMIERLNELRALGISLSIDDFGTGFSSLSYLRKLPISTIKIDQSFVRDMLVNENDRVLVQTIVAMAHNLGHALVAEGIENLQQQIKLAELGCETGQGYLLGRPLPADEFRRVFLDPTASRAK